MTLIKDTVSTFIGGVSQQPDKLIHPTCSKALYNMLLNPVDGLKKRPPTEHVAKLMGPLNVHPLEHTVIKEDEEYSVFLTGNTIKVFDLKGNEKTVTIDANALPYITTNNPLKDLYAITIADYTFVLNKTKIAALSNDVFPNSYASSALIFVLQGDYATDYKISVNGTEIVSHTTSKDDAAGCKTNTICTTLYNALVSKLGTANWSFSKQGSVICLQRKDGVPFTIQTEDSNADRNLYAFYQTADSLDLLPLIAPNGYILKIIGNDSSIADDYYVKFETADGSGFGTGSWQECCKPGIKYKLNPATMPHALVRQGNGSFKFQQIDWTARKAGDEDSAPSPSFLGNTIQDVFTHKGRLAFLSAENSIYSDTQDIFSFFKKTTLAELDTDPIDVGSNSKMVLLKHNLPFNEELLLFSETSEFSIKGGDIFSNSTVTCDLTMEYQCSKNCKPINAGGNGFFVFENGNFSRVMEIFITSAYAIDARDITEQTPSYLPSDIYKMEGSTANNCVCLLSTKTPDTVFIHNYYYSSETKVQSAWSEWHFKNAKILSLKFKENWLYLYLQYPDGIYLEKINFTPKNKEENLDFLFYLDRKTYFGPEALTIIGDETRLELPYTNINEIFILDKNGFPQNFTVSGNTAKVAGAHNELIIGTIYEAKWIFPNIYYRRQTSNGALKVQEGLLMLRDINLTYADTGYFRVKITPKYTSQITSEFEFTGKISGMDSATMGKIPVSSGTFLIPVISQNEEIEIEVINDNYLPSCFLSLEWLGDFSPRGG